MDIDVIIPVYRPGEDLVALLNRLYAQTVEIHKIILVETLDKEEKTSMEEETSAEGAETTIEEAESGEGEAADEKQEKNSLLLHLQKQYKKIELYSVKKEDFDHGMTRRMAVEKSDADIFVMMTQDALPADRKLIEKLTAPLTGDIAVSYARQLARKNCRAIEHFTRRFNCPEESLLKGKENLQVLGIKTYFCSDVCAAYRREIYEKLGGFVQKAIFNEDMLFAAKAVEAGYKIMYTAEARVLHSHNYSISQQFRRNFDLGVSQAEHPEVFKKIPSEKEGGRMVKETTEYLFTTGKVFLIPYFYLQCMGKYAGYFLGKHYKMLPAKTIKKCTANEAYWQ